ncbi:nascent polypeptide-associated complex subunit alpha [Drosophila sechellia]|uniref:GM16784 n=1 Tax=Drosophila sechellia TaxID=7238 RepID=B4ID42_DROSE|nr:nascent polypeptide-associated complex subunit alpha [Drosophila sechellia]EDW45468.1 GM16784 [Drosophila sechellia]
MGKKQKMKKAAQMAAAAEKLKLIDNVVATKEKPAEEASPSPGCSGKKGKPKETKKPDVAKALQKETTGSEDALDAKSNPPPGFSGAKGKPHIMGEMDPAHRNKIKKLLSLAKQLQPNVFSEPNSQKEGGASTEDSSEVEDDQSTDSDDAPDLVEADPKEAQTDEQGQISTVAVQPREVSKQSRGERKARKILMKLDLKPMENVARVTMKKSKNILLYIDKPDVYRVAHSSTYIFFGEVCVEDISSTSVASQAAVKAAERFRGTSPSGRQGREVGKAPGEESPLDDDEDDGENADDMGLYEKDIELVQMQATCSRKKAIQALLKNDNDVVNAIMALTVD